MSESAVATPETLADLMAAPRPEPALARRVLLTGASGMLGSDLAPVLAGAGMDVFARPKSDLDITSERDVVRAFRETRPDVVVNCAALTHVDACESDPRAFEVNARAVEGLASQCVLQGAQLVQISTDFVFNGDKSEPYIEEDPTDPLSAYGRSKCEGERAALRVPTALVIRASWLFGSGGWNFVEAILKQVEEGKRHLRVVADQRGRPTAAPDLAQAILALLQSGAVGIYHFANRGEISWFDFARAILVLAGGERVEIEPIDSTALVRPARRPAYSVLDTSKYERATDRSIRHFGEALVEYMSLRARPEA